MTFNPVLKDGQVICLTVYLEKRIVLVIKDSMKVIPGSLGKLAKDLKVETQKDHFPHYFNPIELHGTLDWSGPLPKYNFFESKRTSIIEYNELVKVFKNKPFSISRGESLLY